MTNDLTDGVAATTFGWGNPNDEWFSFYYNAGASEVNVDRLGRTNVGNAVIDLADYYSLRKRVHRNAVRKRMT